MRSRVSRTIEINENEEQREEEESSCCYYYNLLFRPSLPVVVPSATINHKKSLECQSIASM